MPHRSPSEGGSSGPYITVVLGNGFACPANGAEEKLDKGTAMRLELPCAGGASPKERHTV